SLVMILTLIRSGRLKLSFVPLLYLVVLMPSTAMVLSEQSWTEARDQISFNLSGPVALVIAAWFFSKVVTTESDLRWMFVAFIGPAVGIAGVATSATLASDVTFYDASNVVTSGGFGPNQVSGTMGLGALLALLMHLDRRMAWSTRLLMVGALGWLAVQTALTFSRGGLYMAGGATLVAASFAARDAHLRSRVLLVLAALVVVANFVVLPYLNAFTAGGLVTRFEDTDLTGRDRMVRGDIELWKQNFWMGVGPGGGRLNRGTFFVSPDGSTVAGPTLTIAAHTEFSRLLAEHGVFGLAALFLFIGMGIASVRRQPDPRIRAVCAALMSWSVLFMLSYATRTFAPSFAFGLGAALHMAGREAPGRGGSFARGSMRRLATGHPALAADPPSEAAG
ncbi:MAG: O-antigen ligase family protein, partial [Vicinamibacterales bacterium]